MFRIRIDRTVLCVAMVCLTVLLVAFFIYPTPYIYHVRPDVQTCRINRITGSYQRAIYREYGPPNWYPSGYYFE